MSPASDGNAVRLRISLEGIDPPIWREVVFLKKTTLHELHRAIQVLFSWYDYHLYEFEIDGVSYLLPDDEAEGEDSTKTNLLRILGRPGQRFRYTYDLGDDWHHLIEVLDVELSAEPSWVPYLLDGERQGPPEDCGGPYRYERLIQAQRSPLEELDEEDRELVEWAGDFDPEEFSVAQARHALLLSSAWGSLKRKR